MVRAVTPGCVRPPGGDGRGHVPPGALRALGGRQADRHAQQVSERASERHDARRGSKAALRLLAESIQRRGVHTLPAGGGRVASSAQAALASRWRLIGGGTLAGRRCRLHGRRLHRRSIASARPTSRRRTRSRSPCSTATTGCCAPSRRRTAAGAFPSKPTTSTSATSPCSWPSRTSASTAHGGVDIALARARRLAARRAPPHRLRRLDAHHAGGAPDRGPARALQQRQAAPDRRRAAARASADQAADPRPLPAARAVRRQHRGRARGIARLLRQGAAPPVRRRGGAARRAAAVARMAPPGPQPERSARRARPRARSGRRRKA